MKIFGGTLEMKTKNLLVGIKCTIFLCLILFISGCATYKQDGFPSELLGTWFYEFKTPDGLNAEQAYTFNSDGSGTVETRRYTRYTWAGQTSNILRPEDVTVNNLSPSSQRGKIDLTTNDSTIQISCRIVNNYLIISGVSNNFFNQSSAKYRKLSDSEVEKWRNANGKLLSEI